MPVGGDFGDAGGSERRHRGHPGGCRLSDIGFRPFCITVGTVIELRIVVHEGVVIFLDFAVNRPVLSGRHFNLRCRTPQADVSFPLRYSMPELSTPLASSP